MRPERLLVDSSLLLLLVVGTASVRYIVSHKRLKDDYTDEDFVTLVDFISKYSGIILTPYTLTEAYNLSNKAMREPAESGIRRAFAVLIDRYRDHYIPAAVAAEHPAFIRLGLVDAMIMAMVAAEIEGRRPVLLTTDLDLAIAVEMAGHAVVNFNHIRDV